MPKLKDIHPKALNAEPGTWQETALAAWRAIASDFWKPGASQPPLEAFWPGQNAGPARRPNPQGGSA